MAKGLALTTLFPSGTDRYSTGKALLDVSGISDATLRLQVAQALDLGFQCRMRSATMTATCSGIDTGASHGVRFLDKVADALAGTGVVMDPTGAGGFSIWRFNGTWNQRFAPVEGREDLRVWLNPTGGYFSVDGRGFAYNRLVNVLWHEMHHLTTVQHHIRPTAPYDPGDPWIPAIADIARAFPRTVRDPVTGQQVLLIAADQWTQASRPRRAIG